MSGTTPVNGWLYSDLGDSANIETAVKNPLLLIDQRVVPVFATVGARTAAFSAPEAGQLAYVTATNELYIYNNDTPGWISAVPRRKWKPVAELVANNTLQDDDHLNFSVEANSVYLIEYEIFIVCGSNAVGFQVDWSVPAGGTWRVGITSLFFGAQSNAVADEAHAGPLFFDSLNGTIEMHCRGIFKTVATSGTVKFRWAQFVTGAGTPVAVGDYSSAVATKIV